MELLIKFLILFIALEHLGFLYLEMFLWSTSAGKRIFGHNTEQAAATKVLAANQGLYNGFIFAGLIWGLVHSNPLFGQQIIMFFLACIVLAGIYGGLTANKSIFYIQALPAITATTLVIFNI